MLSDATAWLPTRAGAVIPCDAPNSARKIKPELAIFEPKTVQIVTPAGAQACAFFAECLDRETFGDDVRIGPGVTTIAHALRFAFTLVAGKHVLPDLIVKGKTEPRACGKPILGAAERATYDNIAAALPPVTAALTADEATRPRPFDARATLDAILNYFVDAAMRLARPAVTKSLAAKASLHARWLAALDGPDATFSATPGECVELAAAIDAWRRPVVEERTATYRLCLRVEEPHGPNTDTNAQAWNVSYLLRSRSDPTFLVEGTAALRSGALRREYLTALGRQGDRHIVHAHARCADRFSSRHGTGVRIFAHRCSKVRCSGHRRHLALMVARHGCQSARRVASRRQRHEIRRF